MSAIRRIFPGLCLALLIITPACKERRFPNVVFISLDSTRSDYVDSGSAALARAVTPELKRFSARSIIFDQAYSPIPATLPSHVSIFTGVYPLTHGVWKNEQNFKPGPPTLQERLSGRGYQTSAIVSLGSLAGNTGFKRGFSRYQDDICASGLFYATAAEVTSKALSEIDRLAKADNPFFLFLHYSDPHSPYAPPGKEARFEIRLDGVEISAFNAYQGAILRLRRPLAKGTHILEFRLPEGMADFHRLALRKLSFGASSRIRLKGLAFNPERYGGCHDIQQSEARIEIDCPKAAEFELFQVIPILTREATVECYSGEVEYLDRELGAVFRRLDDPQLRDNTAIVVFADHGEGLGEKEGYVGHIRHLNQQFLRVPLFMRLPGCKPRRVAATVSLTALAPTILDLLKMNPAAGSLLPLAKGETTDAGRAVYAFTEKDEAGDQLFSIIRRPYQYIYFLHDGNIIKRQFYDFRSGNPFSYVDQFREAVLRHADEKAFLWFQAEAERIRRELLGSPPKSKAAEADRETLESLGYIR